MKKLILLCSLTILIFACKSFNDIPDEMHEIDFKHKEMFNITSDTENFILSSDIFNTMKNNLSSFSDFIDSYKEHGNIYQKSYSSLTDNEEIKIASIEYLMSRDGFLSKLKSEERNQLLCLTLEKQEKKFDAKFVSPIKARQTGLFLIIKLLSIDKEHQLLSDVSKYCDSHQFKYGIYNDKEFNLFLLKSIKTKCE